MDIVLTDAQCDALIVALVADGVLVHGAVAESGLRRLSRKQQGESPVGSNPTRSAFTPEPCPRCGKPASYMGETKGGETVWLCRQGCGEFRTKVPHATE